MVELRSKRARRKPVEVSWNPSYPVGIERGYRAALILLVSGCYARMREELAGQLQLIMSNRSDSGSRVDNWPWSAFEAAVARFDFSELLAQADRATGVAADGTVRHNESTFRQFALKAVGVKAIPVNYKELIDAWSASNAELIRSIPRKFLRDVAASAREMVIRGNSMRDFREELKHQYDLTRNRAELIARTEVGKLNSAVTRKRQESLGIDVYRWRTLRDERTRKSHAKLDGKYCKYSDDSVYADKPEGPWKKRSSIGGYVGDPGTDFQCRCTGTAAVTAYLDSLGI